jgi:hypothetical protein
VWNLKTDKSFTVDLEVEHIVPVVWNKEAFRSLVANSNTKDLITARITNHLATENATDLISGKGTGESPSITYEQLTQS